MIVVPLLCIHMSECISRLINTSNTHLHSMISSSEESYSQSDVDSFQNMLSSTRPTTKSKRPRIMIITADDHIVKQIEKNNPTSLWNELLASIDLEEQRPNKRVSTLVFCDREFIYCAADKVRLIAREAENQRYFADLRRLWIISKWIQLWRNCLRRLQGFLSSQCSQRPSKLRTPMLFVRVEYIFTRYFLK